MAANPQHCAWIPHTSMVGTIPLPSYDKLLSPILSWLKRRIPSHTTFYATHYINDTLDEIYTHTLLVYGLSMDRIIIIIAYINI